VTERPYATWELILMAAVLLGWAAIGIRVLAAVLRHWRSDREAARLSRWRPPPTNRRKL